MELHPSGRLTPGGASDDRVAAYLARLPLDDARQRELARAVTGLSPELATPALHRALGKSAPTLASAAAESADNPAQASLTARLSLAGADPAVIAPAHPSDACCLLTMPRINRSPMAPRHWPPRLWPLGRWRQHADESEPGLAHAHHDAGQWRRALLLALSASQTILATWAMTAVLPYHGGQLIELAILALFALLFFWVSTGFWTALLGFLLLAFGRDRHSITASAAADAPIDAAARTAIVMPICNEDVERVFAGLRATYESVAQRGAGELERFDFFVLSDSNQADIRVDELTAWLALCREQQGFGRIFYRWRRNRIKRKSGNVADFCRRWGKDYRYMVILDADSVMTGACLTRLVQLMEANSDAGIIQTAPVAAGKKTLHARIQQFANRLYGPLFTAGLHFWQLGESHYWGHNAIIRVAPFIHHCALGRLLKSRGGDDGAEVEILSHDFVEAALMRRAGWAVWIAYDLPGSFEEMPPNLLDELARDRRWCQGNLINSRLLLAEGLHPAHRAVFASGVMAYLSAPLWFLFLLLSTLLLALQVLLPPTYFQEPYQLFPVWPEWHQDWAVWLFTATTALLFTPKVLAFLLRASQGARDFGGGVRLALSTLGEIVYSMLLAPIRMLFHSQFVAAAIAGWHGGWTSPPRDDVETRWRDALVKHGAQTLLGIVWAAGVYWLNPAYLWWLLPVVGALILAMPISVGASRVGVGERLRRAGFFLIPEETDAPHELRELHRGARDLAPRGGFVAAVADPLVNAIACAVSSRNPNSARASNGDALVAQALENGAEALSPRQKIELIDNPQALARLHLLVWGAGAAHPSWRQATAALPCTVATS